MIRQIFAVLVLLAAVIPICAQERPASGKRPNVLFIICDDLTTTALGCYGNTVCKTPNIDRLAARGVRFERAYCQWPLCWPSRASFLSGQRPDSRFNKVAMVRSFLPDAEFLPEHFRKNGYFTARVGKIFHCKTVFNNSVSYEDPACWDVSELGGTDTDPCGYAVQFSTYPKGLPAHPEIEKYIDHHELLNKAGNPGYDYWMDMAAVNLPDEGFTDGTIAKRISQLMDEHAKADKPFFLAAGFRRPHLLWVAPKQYFDMYPPAEMKLAEFPADDLNDIPKLALTRRAPEMSPLQRQTAISSYYACVSFVDAQLGKLVDQMDKLKLWDSTIVVFTSDHGWHLGEHDSLWGKVTLFQEASKVPLIIAAPGLKPGASPRTVEMLDIYPTLIDLAGMAGLSTPKNLDGVSLRPLLNDPEMKRDRPAFTVLKHSGKWGKSINTERYRYTEWADGQGSAELYDLQADPKEFHNLAKDESAASVREQLKKTLHEALKGMGAHDTTEGASENEKE
ncbi:MAG TPA: sulfatase [Tepidisphaeraceae bacterium]|nr:sulfatase [Tepidisphaeraceae bacterium]